MLRYVCFVWMILPAGVVYPQCWPTTVDSAITVAPGWYPYAAVDEVEQSVMVVYLAGAQIRVKKYDKYGCPMWGGNPAIALDTVQRAWLGFWGNQWGQVISDDSGGVVICWVDFRHSDISDGEPVNDEVFAQRIDVNGQARYGPNGMRVSGPHTDGYHTIGDMKTDYRGGYAIAYGGDSSHTRTALKRYAMNGELQWARYFESTGGIDLNATDVWGSSFVSTGGRRYKFDLQGNSLWPGGLPGHIPDNINFDQGGAYSDGEGGAIGVTSWYVAPNYVISVNRVDSNGTFVFPSNIDVGFGGFMGHSADSEGGLDVSWNPSDVRIQRICKNGNVLYDSLGLSICSYCGNDGEIVSDQRGGLISVWLSTVTYDSLVLYSQRVDSAGRRAWDSSGNAFHVSYNEFFEFPVTSLHSNKAGGAVYLWTELGNGLEIKLKHISRNGVLGEIDSTTSITEVDRVPKGFTLYPNHPNPFNNSTTISFQLNKRCKVQLQLYNILGQEVKTLINESKQEGMHNYQLDMSLFASGVYIYRLTTPEGSKSKKLLFIK